MGLFFCLMPETTMKAAILEAVGKLRLADVPRPACPPGGLVIEVRACAVCTTDVKMVQRGQRDLRYPRVLGHEVAGVVAECDAGVEGLEPGQRVHVAPGVACGRCAACRRGADNRCERIEIIGFSRDGGFAQWMAAPAESVQIGGVTRLPDALPFELAALAEPLACCINAQDRLHLTSADRLLVLGGGPVGCLHVMLARARGVGEVLLVERSPARARLAEAAGATRIIVSEPDQMEAQVRWATGDEGVDAAVAACADADVDSLVRALRPGGRLCLFSGLHPQRATAQLDANRVHYEELGITGAYGCTARQNRQATELIASKAVDASWLVTMRVPLDRIQDAIDYTAERSGMKAVVTGF